MMQTLVFTLRPLTAFGTPLAGDTLFGQLCWTLRHQLGNERLHTLLQGYTSGAPFAVLSDAFPSGHLPLPHVASAVWAPSAGQDRKALKKRRWIPLSALQQPMAQWQQLAKTDAQLCSVIERDQPHNSINRQSGTTGEGAFAPFVVSQRWYPVGTCLDLYVLCDEQRLSRSELGAALAFIGAAGFGRDASTGLGKFELCGEPTEMHWPQPTACNSYLTLGPCAPQGQGFCPQRSSWQVLTRFGRHGDAAVHGGNPFKKPLLLAQAGAVLWPLSQTKTVALAGQGLGGAQQPISQTMPETVHQGYALVLPIELPQGASA